MQNASHSIRDELHGVLLFIGVVWAVFFLSYLFPSLVSFGVTPRTLHGLVGIAAMPFLHANLHHIVANTVPLFVLLALLAGSNARSWEVVLGIIVLGGLLLWLFGRSATHIGASGLVFGLIVFLIVSGFLEKRPLSLLIAVIVGFLYGGSLISGILPRFGSQISWGGHLWSAMAGGIVAYGLTRRTTEQETVGVQ